MHRALAWLLVKKKRVILSFCVCFRNIVVYKIPNVLFNLLLFTQFNTRHALKGLLFHHETAILDKVCSLKFVLCKGTRTWNSFPFF